MDFLEPEISLSLVSEEKLMSGYQLFKLLSVFCVSTSIKIITVGLDDEHGQCSLSQSHIQHFVNTIITCFYQPVLSFLLFVCLFPVSASFLLSSLLDILFISSF